MRISIFTIGLLAIFINVPSISQVISSENELSFEMSYDIHVNYPALSISKTKLEEANTLNDLDRNYKPTWVREYLSVEVQASYKGKLQTASSMNDILSLDQQAIMKRADRGSSIIIKVKYIPENTLKQNEPKEHIFSFKIHPEKNALYTDGKQELKAYLKQNIIDKIPSGILNKYQLAAVTFIIDEKGQVQDPNMFLSTEDENIDKLLLETIRNMKNWQPAVYEDGTIIKQELVLTVGDMNSCAINMLNIELD